MPDIVLISGSPSATSRSAALLEYARRKLGDHRLDAAVINVRDFPATELMLAKYDSPVFAEAQKQIVQAVGIVVGTPIYKAAYAGTLKTFLDILPQTAFRGKTVLAIASGGSPAHLLAIDYALKPVLSALGATDLPQGVYATDDQVKVAGVDPLWLHDDLRSRLDAAIDHLATQTKARLVR
jgi:FMN reductase